MMDTCTMTDSCKQLFARDDPRLQHVTYGVLQLVLMRIIWPEGMAWWEFEHRVTTIHSRWNQPISCCTCTETLGMFVPVITCQEGHSVDIECLHHQLDSMVASVDPNRNAAVPCPICASAYNELDLLHNLNPTGLGHLMRLQKQWGEMERAVGDVVTDPHDPSAEATNILWD
jgi:hypothetical protein